MGLRGLGSLFQVGLMMAVLSACAPKVADGGSETVRPQIPEKPYASSPIVYSGPQSIITATARYDRYDDSVISGNVASNKGLHTIVTNNPIRYAEVHLLTSGGVVIQQGETDGSGNISMSIPQTPGTYILRVNSRAENAHYKVSILKDPYSTEYYSLETAFDLGAGEAVHPVTMSSAPATNDTAVLGGAFSILDLVLNANEFLRAEAYKPSCTNCIDNFSVAPKIQIFWAKGLTPAAYFGQPTSPISFFMAESSGGIYRGVYILGGIEGDVCTDTDHFDRSVVLHEYGHFLENAFGKSGSPGGPHNGNSILDPRLAWSEGWADFFQAAVLGRNYYRDTKRNAGCRPLSLGATAQLSFPDFDLEAKVSGNATDIPVADEGIFREISIARSLYDTMTGAAQSATYKMNVDTDAKAADLGFAPIWHSFKTMANSQYRFQNMGMHNELTKASVASRGSPYVADYAAVLAHEEQADSRRLYGQNLIASGGSCTFTFASGGPVPDTTDSAGYTIFSDPLRSNDFFQYVYDGTNPVVRMRYKKTGFEASVPYDLDLYVYSEKHTLNDIDNIVAFSENVYPETGNNATDTGHEVINLSNRAPGVYLINIKVFMRVVRATTSYYLENGNGVRLCP